MCFIDSHLVREQTQLIKTGEKFNQLRSELVQGVGFYLERESEKSILLPAKEELKWSKLLILPGKESWNPREETFR